MPQRVIQWRNALRRRSGSSASIASILRLAPAPAAATRMIAALPRDLTVLMIEHDMDVALGLADRGTVLHRGRVMLEGTPGEVQAHPDVREVYFGRV